MMESVDNNQFEIKPNEKIKRKITPCPNAYLNPALDLLANEDPMCNTAMEVVPNKKRKRTRSCDIAAFENSALDLGISKAALNEFLAKELENVRRNVKNYDFETRNNKENVVPGNKHNEPIYINLTENSVPNKTQVSIVNDAISLQEVKKNNVDNVGIDSGISVFEGSSLVPPKMDSKNFDSPNILNTNVLNTNNQIENLDISAINNITNIQTNVSNQIVINNSSNLSFIDRLALDSPNISSQSLYYDDDLNESNIMEIKTITIITKKKRIPPNITNTNPFLNSDLENPKENCTTPPNIVTTVNPFTIESEPEPNYTEEALNRPTQQPVPQETALMPRRLFMGDTNSTISTVYESSITLDNHEYENVDSYRSDSPIYENVADETVYEQVYNKQSKVLGYDVSKLNSVDIMNKNSGVDISDESNDNKRDLKHHILKAGNKFSKKVFRTLKKTFKPDKPDSNTTLNPYEVPRKAPKQKSFHKDIGYENPALNLDNSDDIEMEEIDDDEHQYETVKTLRNTRLNMNVTPLRERCDDNADLSQSKTNTPGKKVRFDSTLNQEKVITGNSFDCGIQSPGFDAKIDKFHDELENCINERKYIQQNM